MTSSRRTPRTVARSGSGWLLAATLSLTVGCAGPDDDDATSSLDDRTTTAEALCPVLWDWVTAMGDAFNDASRSVADIDDPDDRRRRWRAAFDDMDAVTDALVSDLDAISPNPELDRLMDEITAGIVDSRREVDELVTLLETTPDVDLGRHQDRTQQLIVRVEKVIDVVKPELARYDEPELIDAFRTVPSCQHAVKDVDDGVPRFNG